jgi:hypothetical protein
VCLDSTHNTPFSVSGQKEKVFLNTVVIKNLKTGRGTPVTFMLTPNKTQYAVGNFLKWLCTIVGFCCLIWMIVYSFAEVARLLAGIGPHTIIWWCLWHVLKAVHKQTKEKYSVGISSTTRIPLAHIMMQVKSSSGTKKVVVNKVLHDAAVTDFKCPVFAEDKKCFDTTWEELQVTYMVHYNWLCYLVVQ